MFVVAMWEVSTLGKRIFMEQSTVPKSPIRVTKFKELKATFADKVAEIRRIAGKEIPEELGFAWSTIILGALLVTLQVLFVTILLGMMA
ncbi:hypothetical protein D3C87_1587970 [compost metagenome]